MNVKEFHRNSMVLLSVLTFAISAFVASHSADAAVVIHGSATAYQESGGDWLSMGANDIDGSGGLGSDGYIFYGRYGTKP